MAVEARDPDEVVAVVPALEVEGRLLLDRLAGGYDLETAIGAVRGFDHRRVARRVGRHGQLGESGAALRVEHDSDTRLVEARVALGRPVRGRAAVCRRPHSLGVLRVIPVRIEVAQRHETNAVAATAATAAVPGERVR